MKTARRRSNRVEDAPGLRARHAAAEVVESVLRKNRPLDEQLEGGALTNLPERDRALARAIVATALRRLGTLRAIIGAFLEHGLPAQAPRVETALLIGSAQILFLDIPDHAAVDLSVRLAQADRQAVHFAKLVNAVLRRIAREGKERLAALDSVALDTPPWLLTRWIRFYGEAVARDIAAANGREAALDISVKRDAQHWAQALGGRVLSTGSLRTIAQGSVTALPGFIDGAWWVQDAAAALPARLFGAVDGLRVADLCAAPGGKAAQLIAAGARVTAVDRSASRLARLKDNLDRLSLKAELVCADAEKWEAEPFDAVLLDAPCSSTGTIRRHPDVPWLKKAADIVKLSVLQHRLIERAIVLTKPGGTLVYCTCSLEPEEGEDVVNALLARTPNVTRVAITAAEVSGHAEFITEDGDLRTLPCHLPESDSRLAGIDGFYAARLRKVQ